jgi:butyrate kinase
VSSRLVELQARRAALQAECALHRDDVRLVYGGMAARAEKVDRTIDTVRSFAPVIAVGGIAVLVALGPGRALSLLRRGLSVWLYASQALRILR